MSQNPAPADTRNPWPRRSWWFIATVLVVAFLIGFVGLARFEPGRPMLGLWAAMCRAIGIPGRPQTWISPQPALVISSGFAWTPQRRAQAESGNVTRGAFVALNCEVCHAATAPNTGVAAPILAGMDAAVIYKELEDFRSGKRAWGVMNAIARALSADSAADVAAYYARLGGGLQGAGGSMPAGGRSLRQADATLRLVFAGDPERAIAPCAACHGPEAHKLGAPPLEQQRAAYLERQLLAFAQGIRRNDINEQMRTFASQLTPQEVHAIAVFYAGRQVKPDRSVVASDAAETRVASSAQLVRASESLQANAGSRSSSGSE